MKGFTLIETIVAITVSSIVFLAVFGFVYYFYRTSGYNLSQMIAVNSARKGVEIIVRETREATFSDQGSYLIKNAEDQSFTFYSDIDKDLKIERVRYFLDEYILKKGITESNDNSKYLDENEEIRILSNNIRNLEEPIFTYYDENNNEVEDLQVVANIRMIQIKLIVNTDPNRPPGEFTLVSNAQLRNLRYE
ncbi:prepilin-type N-terminal cleavage/methylation domain-containing protein [Patescibacteria group bacterium]|nr:prepilin-type N-terminal cleavage/methylation domain-containing protein [Patescibacteria group bacterium]